MGETEIIILGISAVIAAFKIIEFLVKKNMANKSMLTNDERDMIKTLYDVNNQRDENGIPMVWVPRSWEHSQNKIIDALTDISKHQLETTLILKQLADKLS